METDHFACPNFVPLTVGQPEAPQDYWPSEPCNAQFETIGTEWDTYPNTFGNNVWDESLSYLPVDSPLQERDFPNIYREPRRHAIFFYYRV